MAGTETEQVIGLTFNSPPGTMVAELTQVGRTEVVGGETPSSARQVSPGPVTLPK